MFGSTMRNMPKLKLKHRLKPKPKPKQRSRPRLKLRDQPVLLLPKKHQPSNPIIYATVNGDPCNVLVRQDYTGWRI
jgi:hypothetical protein